jgi:hypothetical protein
MTSSQPSKRISALAKPVFARYSLVLQLNQLQDEFRAIQGLSRV